MAKKNPVEAFSESRLAVTGLLHIHRALTGSAPGRRKGVEVLNKSAVVLATACWEAFIEDLAMQAFDFLVRNTQDPKGLPGAVKREVARAIDADKNEIRMWNLAASGWETELAKHRAGLFKRYVGRVNSPRPHVIDELFSKLVGLKGVSKCWYWQGMSNEAARAKLEGYVKMRGAIAHGVSTSRSVTKGAVIDYLLFLYRLVAKTNNHVVKFVKRKVGEAPWPMYQIGKTK